MNFEVTQYGQDGQKVGAIELTEQEYQELERAMQWPEDLARYDRINKPITEHDLGISIFGGSIK